MGMERSLQAISDADVILFVVDTSREPKWTGLYAKGTDINNKLFL